MSRVGERVRLPSRGIVSGAAVVVAVVVVIGVLRAPWGARSDASPVASPFCDAIVGFNDGYQAAEDRAADADWSPAAVELAYGEWLRLERELLAAAPPAVRDAQQVLVDGYEPVIEALEDVSWHLGRVDPAVFDYTAEELAALDRLNDHLTEHCAVPYFSGLGFDDAGARCLARELNDAGRSLYGDLARTAVEAALLACDLPPDRADLWDY